MEAHDSPPVRTEPAKSVFGIWHLPDGIVPWITLGIIAISGIATLLWLGARDTAFLALYARGDEIWLRYKWRALIGSGFVHSGPLHLLFNCYWLWLFGRVLEVRLGRLRYMVLIAVTIWMASVGELAWSGNPGIGMSGTVYGMFGFLSVARRCEPAFALLVPKRIVALFWAWLFLCMVPAVDDLKVANGGHVAGLLAGAVYAAATIPGRWRTPVQVGAVAAACASFVPLVWAPWQDGWLAAKVYSAMEQRDFDAALRWCAKIGPGRYADWSRRNEENIRRYQSAVGKSRAELLRQGENTEDVEVLNNVAWQLATSPHEHLRDGAIAVVFATRACAISGWINPAFLDTLAAAHAECGDFDEAEKWMARALETPGSHAAILEEHRAAFRSHRKWREDAIFHVAK